MNVEYFTIMHIQPILDYCDTIWGNCAQYYLKRILKHKKEHHG